jgi:hypothetical protein
MSKVQGATQYSRQVHAVTSAIDRAFWHTFASPAMIQAGEHLAPWLIGMLALAIVANRFDRHHRRR